MLYVLIFNFDQAITLYLSTFAEMYTPKASNKTFVFAAKNTFEEQYRDES